MNIAVAPADLTEMMNLISAQDNMSYEAMEIMARAGRNSSRLWAGSVDDEVVCYFGLIPPTLMSDTAYLWLYTTPALREYTFSFIRYSQMAVQEMLREYPRIVGHGRAGDEKSLRWLKFIGAKFGQRVGEFIT